MVAAAAVASSSSPLLFKVLPAASPDNANARIHRTSRLFLSTSRPFPLLTPLLKSRPFLAFSRRSRNNPPTAAPSRGKKLIQDDHGGEDDLDEDAFEALFSQLEEDLKNDDRSANDGDDQISEEDLARLEQELSEAFGDVSEDELSGTMHSNIDNVESHDYDDAYSDEEEERPVKLRTWQLRRLASALKIGRRKISIKSLAGELGLDRAVVLELLREPPPDLLLMCASLPDTVVQTSSRPNSQPFESSPVTMTDGKSSESPPVTMTDSKPSSSVILTINRPTLPVTSAEPESKHAEPSKSAIAKPKAVVNEPIHVMRKRWFMQKRLKKVQLETLEKVYSRTKRPTNAMISSIVHVTSLPWKKVVKWFEDKRQEDGIPEERVPYRRHVPETVSSD